MVYMRIYWKKEPDALRQLMEKYATHPDVRQIGYCGLEVVIFNEETLKDIKKYCRYRPKKLIIEEIEELELIDEDEWKDGLEEEVNDDLDILNSEFADECDEYLDDEWDEKMEEERLLSKKIDLTGDDLFNSWNDFMYIYDETEPKPDFMDFYKYPDCQPTCECDYDECTCEEQSIKQEIISQWLIEGKYISDTWSERRCQEREKMKNYY